MPLITTRQYHDEWETARGQIVTDIKRVSDGADRRWSQVFGDGNQLDLAGAVRNRLGPANGGVGGQVVLLDAPTLQLTADALNAHTVFYVEAAGNRTMLRTPVTNVLPGTLIIIAHKAIGGANRTLTLTGGGESGSFGFGSTIAGLTATVSGTTDYIDCLYNSITRVWSVVKYVKGY